MKYITALLLITLAFTQVNGQEKKEDKSVKIKIKDNEEVVVYIDGKEVDRSVVDLLDEDKIESVTVVKGKEAKKKYNTDKGVVLIKSKKSQNKIVINSDGSKDPIFVIDGKVMKKGKIKDLDPDDIESIEVIKGEKALKEYNSTTGVIIIKTKKK